MSIYLEFPAIAEYPIYGNPFINDEEKFSPEEEQLRKAREEQEALKDFLQLRMV